MRKSWDWLVKRIAERASISVSSLLLAGFATLTALATAWLLWPVYDSDELTTFSLPTASPTRTRVVVHRKPTPTAFFPTATPVPLIHVVEEGEVLGLIAEEYDTTLEALLAANGLEDADLVSIGQELIVVDAEGTPVTVELALPSPTATRTSAFVYAAPALIGPSDGAEFRGPDTQIDLQWTSVAILGESEWYEVKLWSLRQGNDYRVWTKTSSWAVPVSLCPGESEILFHWNVMVVQRSDRQSTPLSPAGLPRRFSWY